MRASAQPTQVAESPRRGAEPPSGRIPLGTEALVVAVLTVVGLGLRLAVADQSVMADELSTYWIVSTKGLGGVISTVNGDAEITPPLYFMAAWLTTQIDLSPELLRAPSVVAGVLTIPAVYLLGLRTVGRLAALVAAALTALAPFMVYQSAEARGYALMTVLIVGSTLAMLIAAEDRRKRWWVAYAACSCMAMYSHYTAVFVLGAQLVWLLWAHPDVRRAALLANVAAAFAFLPWLGGLLNDFDSPTTDVLSALLPFDWLHVRLSLQHWSIGDPLTIVRLRDVPGTIALVLLGLAAGLAVVGVAVNGRRGRWPDLGPPRRRTLLIVTLALATPVGASLFSAIGTTQLVSARNLSASWPALALAFAALLISAGPRLRIVAAALAIGCFAIGAPKMLEDRFQRTDYQAAANFVDRSAGPRDVVIDETGVFAPSPFSPLYVALGRRDRILRAGGPEAKDRPPGFPKRIMPLSEASKRAVALARGGRIFLVADVYFPVDSKTANALERPTKLVASPFPPRYRLVEKHAYQGVLGVLVQVYADRS